MRVLFFLNIDTLKGGAEGVLQQVINYYLNEEASITVFVFYERQYGGLDSYEKRGVKVVYGNGPKKFLKALPLIRKERYDLAFSSSVLGNSLWGILKKIGVLKIRAIVGRESTSVFPRYHGLKLLQYKFLYRIGYSSISLLICQTDYMKAQLTKNLPWLEKRVKVLTIPNPISLSSSFDDKEKTENNDINIYLPYIIGAGRIISEKGFDLLIESFATIKKSYDKMHLLILGSVDQTAGGAKILNDLKDIIKAKGLENSVHFLGFKQNILPYYKNAEVCVISSRIEGFPNALLQMMSQNNKVVSTLCAGGIENIEGLITCPPQDSAALSNAILKSLKEDSEKKRVLFDRELESRSIESFMRKINESIS